MKREHLNIIRSYLEQAIDGLSKENPKFDFKRDWYDLKNKKGINEFLKDTSSIANTYGPEGFIVIGFDEKTKQFKDTDFKASGLNDTNEIYGLINKRVDRLFEINLEDIEIDGHSLSVLHIPPSIDKPHVIKNYQTFEKDGILKKEENHKIFVRKNTSAFTATKYDLELMYYDRKNIKPEFKVITVVDIHLSKFINDSRELIFEGYFSFENIGLRPVAIFQMNLLASYELDSPLGHKLARFKTIDKLRQRDIIVSPNQLIRERIRFKCKGNQQVDLRNIEKDLNKNLKKTLINSELKIMMSNKDEINCEILVYE